MFAVEEGLPCRLARSCLYEPLYTLPVGGGFIRLAASARLSCTNESRNESLRGASLPGRVARVCRRLSSPPLAHQRGHVTLWQRNLGRAVSGSRSSRAALSGTLTQARDPRRSFSFGATPSTSTAQPATSAPASSLFGGAAQASTTPAGGLFGAPKSAAATPSLFGSTTTSAPPPSLGGLFGTSAPAPAASKPAFSFGTPAPAASAAPATTGLFGPTTATSQPPQAGAGLFGQAAPAAGGLGGGLFGAQGQAQGQAPAQGGGLFGSQQPR